MNFYLNKYGFLKPQISESSAPNLGMAVVIPCFNEPDLISSLESLKACDSTKCDVEIIVVINSGIEHDEAIKIKNQVTFEISQKWAEKNSTDKLKFHFIHIDNLPQKHAGVGLARKIGMDEAVSRFDFLKKDGVIVCYDADSLCDKNFLVAIENHFFQNPKTPGCSIYFEHPVSGNEFGFKMYDGIINYELHLRYYVLSLRFCELPFAFHTIGSSMAVRSSFYQKQGGMNKRKAGEDFYFLHKIIELGNFTELKTTRVIPSPRVSDRVPFGTGRAMGEWMGSEKEGFATYNFKSFQVIRNFVKKIPDLYEMNLDEIQLTDQSVNIHLINFLKAEKFESALTEIRKNSPNRDAFIKRFFVWFDAFRVLKLVHYLRDNAFDNSVVSDEVNEFLKASGDAFKSDEASALLLHLRNIEKRELTLERNKLNPIRI